MVKGLRSYFAFIAFALAVVGFLYAFSGHRTPRVPDDEAHKIITDKTACIECHGPGKLNELKATHPPKDECMICHKVRKYRKI